MISPCKKGLQKNYCHVNNKVFMSPTQPLAPPAGGETARRNAPLGLGASDG